MNKKEAPHPVVTLLRELGGVKRALAKTNSIINAVQTARFEQYPRLNPDRFTGLSYIEQAGRVSGIAEALKKHAKPHLVNKQEAITEELIGHIGQSKEEGMIAGVIFERAKEELTSFMGIATPPRPTLPEQPSITQAAPSPAVESEGKPTEPSAEEELPLPPNLSPIEIRIVTAVKAGGKGAEGLPRDELARAVWPDQPLEPSVKNLKSRIGPLNTEKLMPAGFQVRNIAPLGAGMKAVYRYERYTPPPKEPSSQPPTLRTPSKPAQPEPPPASPVAPQERAGGTPVGKRDGKVEVIGSLALVRGNTWVGLRPKESTVVEETEEHEDERFPPNLSPLEKLMFALFTSSSRVSETELAIAACGHALPKTEVRTIFNSVLPNFRNKLDDVGLELVEELEDGVTYYSLIPKGLVEQQSQGETTQKSKT